MEHSKTKLTKSERFKIAVGGGWLGVMLQMVIGSLVTGHEMSQGEQWVAFLVCSLLSLVLTIDV